MNYLEKEISNDDESRRIVTLIRKAGGRVDLYRTYAEGLAFVEGANGCHGINAERSLTERLAYLEGREKAQGGESVIQQLIDDVKRL